LQDGCAIINFATPHDRFHHALAMNPEEHTAATRLCAACGMCCNGVLFYSLLLQPSDSARKLTALGLKIKHRKDGRHIPQPCPAHAESRCTIYAQRPVRCQKFACRQLQALEAGQTTEETAREKIAEAQRRIARVRTLFHQAGETRETKAFSTRYESLFTEPLDPSPDAVALRQELKAAMSRLENLLSHDFRTEPTSPILPD
jgi:Fe-S-cluster containining protein